MFFSVSAGGPGPSARGPRPSSSPWLVAALALVLALAHGDATGAQLRRALLPAAREAPQAVRSVIFVHGMTCRACTMLLDRRLGATPGVYWNRFNFPLRLLVVYHDPAVAPPDSILALVGSSGELRAEALRSALVSALPPGEETTLASWKGGALSAKEAQAEIDRFAASLGKTDVVEGSEEWDQFSYEIIGEAVRGRILRERAAAAGFRTGPPGTTLPAVIPREFYWPAHALAPTPEEAGVARFLREQVLLGDEGDKGRARFDDWLLALWRAIDLDFRAEAREAAP